MATHWSNEHKNKRVKKKSKKVKVQAFFKSHPDPSLSGSPANSLRADLTQLVQGVPLSHAHAGEIWLRKFLDKLDKTGESSR